MKNRYRFVIIFISTANKNNTFNPTWDIISHNLNWLNLLHSVAVPIVSTSATEWSSSPPPWRSWGHWYLTWHPSPCWCCWYYLSHLGKVSCYELWFEGIVSWWRENTLFCWGWKPKQASGLSLGNLVWWFVEQTLWNFNFFRIHIIKELVDGTVQSDKGKQYACAEGGPCFPPKE